MLVLTRNRGESLVIGGNITVKILDIQGNKVRIGVDAPREVTIYRDEIKPADCPAPANGDGPP